MLARKQITVFEHQTIKLNQLVNGQKFEKQTLEALQLYYGEKGVPYFTLVHNGVRFNEYVGVIQVGNILIEVLPKADKELIDDKSAKKWRDILIDMMRAVGGFEIKSTSSSSLRIKSNTILDLYFELFIIEVEYLQHKGLIKKYRITEGNTTALKGSLIFAKHIQQNITHQERFYVRHSTYDVEHQLHFILYKAIRLLKQINTKSELQSRLGSLLLNFPEMPNITVSEDTFTRLSFNRKTEGYKKAIDIAKLLLLHYHPDLSKGRNNVLALMFDMNLLWEQFVFVSLHKNKKSDWNLKAQASKSFWKPDNGKHSKMRPDILLTKDDSSCVVFDTKWKNLGGYNPSPEDLRQMYVYHEYYNAKRVALIYPGTKDNAIKGTYMHTPTYKQTDKECSVITVALPVKEVSSKLIIKQWQENISNQLEQWITPKTK